MFDLVQLALYAGDGGDGKVSFRREKFVPKGGPDGGNGGDGGSIFIRGNKNFNTLQHFAGAKEFRAQRGQDGGKQKKIGKNGEDLYLEVPLGTIVWILGDNPASRARRTFVAREGAAEIEMHFQKYYLQRPQGNPPRRPDDNIILLDESRGIHQIRRPSEVEKVQAVKITQDGQLFLLCRGGFGGRGNVTFKGSSNTTPFEAEYGTFGEKKLVLFELKLLADIGLVGYPSAGKSTFLSIITKANPKIGNYPFTTLEPNLGVMTVGGEMKSNQPRDIVVADLPGLIEGASQGKGLGFDFLRHIQGCKALCYLLTLDEGIIFDEEMSMEQKAQALIDQWHVLRQELTSYDKALETKPYIIAISKADLYSEKLFQEVKRVFLEKENLPAHFFSSISKQGIDELKKFFLQYV